MQSTVVRFDNSSYCPLKSLKYIFTMTCLWFWYILCRIQFEVKMMNIIATLSQVWKCDPVMYALLILEMICGEYVCIDVNQNW